jgi:hypothetical protein
MADVQTGALEARGPLSQVGDTVVRKELTKLWNVIEGNAPVANGPKEPHTWATRSDLTTMEAALSKRIDALKTQGQKLSVQAGGSVGSGASSNLLAADNTWTGTNLWTTKATATVKPLRVESLASGPLYVAAPTVMLTQDFMAAVDIQMTSSAADAGQLGGSAALFVQHRATGAAGATALVCAIRAQMETDQTGSVAINDAVAGYLSVLNKGDDANGFGLHVDAYHLGIGNNGNTYGCDVELFGAWSAQTGKLTGYLLRCAGTGDYTRRVDYGFLASPDVSGSKSRIEQVFSAGSDWVGALDCTVAFDAGYANPTLAAIRIRQGDALILDGPYVNAIALRYTGSAVQLQRAGAPILSVTNGGMLSAINGLEIVYPTTVAPTPNLAPSAGPTDMRHFGYFPIGLGGITRWVPFFG